MRNLAKTTVVVAVGVLLLSGLPSEAQEAVTIQQSPELKVLGRYVGTWEWQVVSQAAEWTPKKTTFTFENKVDWILGGRMIQHKWAWSPAGDDIRNISLMGYDAKKKQYTEWHFDSTGAAPDGQFHRTWNEATKTFTGMGRLPNGISSSQTHCFIDDGTIKWTMVFKDRAGKIYLDMAGTAKRK